MLVFSDLDGDAPSDPPARRPARHRNTKIGDAQGIQKSATLRRLVQDVEERCGVVFISEMDLALARRKALGVTVHRITITGPFRFVHVVVDTRPGVGEVIGTIGHELQHVVELLESGATTPAEIEVLFGRIGVRLGPGVFETRAAAEIGEQVRREAQYSDLNRHE